MSKGVYATCYMRGVLRSIIEEKSTSYTVNLVPLLRRMDPEENQELWIIDDEFMKRDDDEHIRDDAE